MNPIHLSEKILFLLLTLALTGCQTGWEINLTVEGLTVAKMTHQDVAFYSEISPPADGTVSLGQLLYSKGFSLIDQIEFHFDDTEQIVYDWEKEAANASITLSGILSIGDQNYSPQTINIIPTSQNLESMITILDIAPTIAHVLGLPDLPEATGTIQSNRRSSHAVMLLLDGLQYQLFRSMVASGDLPFFQNVEQIHQGLSVYPPITTSATASVLTGSPPQINHVYGYGFRSTEQTTLFDLAVQEGKTVIAIEGASLPFNLRNAETTLSGDRDGNGLSDDNVFMNSLSVIQNEMPDLLYIHFHEIDNMGHTYGPDSQQYLSALQRVDGYLSQIYKALPANTFIVIFADHGMHATMDGGNHGTLTEEDLVIPIIFLEK